jgi:hypothetical protein
MRRPDRLRLLGLLRHRPHLRTVQRGRPPRALRTPKTAWAANRRRRARRRPRTRGGRWLAKTSTRDERCGTAHGTWPRPTSRRRGLRQGCCRAPKPPTRGSKHPRGRPALQAGRPPRSTGGAPPRSTCRACPAFLLERCGAAGTLRRSVGSAVADACESANAVENHTVRQHREPRSPTTTSPKPGGPLTGSPTAVGQMQRYHPRLQRYFLQQIGAQRSRSAGRSGAGVTVPLLDSGIHRSRRDPAGQVVTQAACTGARRHHQTAGRDAAPAWHARHRSRRRGR